MCLKPVHVRVKNATLCDGKPVFVEVGCGHCYQCRQRRQNDYYVRSYFEALSTFNKRGYVLMDCLTYAPKYLPHVQDYCSDFVLPDSLNFSCFNSEHVRLFFASLRAALKRRGHDVAHKLRYFLCSEYGTDDKYTHAPHYHILFFVTDPTLLPLNLSDLIGKCWKYGRTDGVDYKGSRYVLGHCTFGFEYNSNIVECLNCTSYVSKYVTKDSSFEKVLRDRVAHIGVWLNDNFLQSRIDNVLPQVKQFLRISKGFGSSILDDYSLEDIIKDGGIFLSDRKSVKRFFPLPSYYRRKLFFETMNFVDNYNKSHIFFNLNSDGVRYFTGFFDAALQRHSDMVADSVLTFSNSQDVKIKSYLPFLTSIIAKFSSTDEFYKRLSLYHLFVRGRYYCDYESSAFELDPEFLKMSNLWRYMFDKQSFIQYELGVGYFGYLQCAHDGLPDNFGTNPYVFDAVNRYSHDLFSEFNLNSYVFQESLKPLNSEEFCLFESFLNTLEICNFLFNQSSNEAYFHKIYLKRKLKPFKFQSYAKSM